MPGFLAGNPGFFLGYTGTSVDRHQFLAALFVAVLAGCSCRPSPYPPPEQRAGPEVEKPPLLETFIAMNDPHAGDYIVGGISPTVEAAAWRWTHRRPELQFHLPSADGWTFVMEFAVAGATFEQTGPVTLSVSVNGKALRKQRYDQPGQYRLEFPVPPEALQAGSLNRVTIQPDKVWVSTDGTALGLILAAAGFRR
jgi:hypothetical protein